MFIKELAITRYGPLHESPPRSLSSFTLFFGKNEYGKTLLVDAIIRLLFKKLGRRKLSWKLDRVSEQPEGYVVLEKDGCEVKLGRDESISKLFEPEISLEDFRNIFVTREGDLSIFSESSYYSNLTEKLTGLRTSEIQAIMETLARLGKLTSPRADSPLSNAQDAGYIAGKLADAGKLLSEMDHLRSELHQREFDLLEKRLVEKRFDLERAKQELELLEKAKARLVFEKAREDLSTLKKVIAELASLEDISHEGLSKWRTCNDDIKLFAEALKGSSDEADRIESRLEILSKELDEKKSDLKRLETIKDRIDGLRARMEETRQKQEEISGREVKSRLWKWGLGFSLVLLGTALAGTIIRGGAFFHALSVIFLAMSGVSAIQLLAFVHGKAKLKQELTSLGLRMAELLGPVESLAAIEKGVADFMGDLEKLRDKAAKMEKEKIEQESRAAELKKKMEELKGSIKDRGEKIRKIKENSGFESMEDYRHKLDRKKELEKKKGYCEGAIENSLGSPPDRDSKIDWWDHKIAVNLDSLESGIDYQEARYDELKNKVDDLEKELSDMNNRLEEGRGKLSALESKIRNIDIPQLKDVYCRTTGELDEIEEKLKAFVREVEDNKVTAQETIRIFKEMEEDEMARISDLFGPNEDVSSYFREITDGFYDEVDFNGRESGIIVKQANGAILKPDDLSGGARDQLYFAIRLSLARRLLKDGKGFFILDDPFVRADYERLKKQIDILRRINKQGWQILYFSAKNEVLDILDEDIKSKRVKLIKLKERV